MKVIFLGTPDFACQSLKSINDSRHEIVAIVTQPDKPANRNMITKPPVKVLAEELGIKVLQYNRISREGVEDLRQLNADIMVTAAYGQILSREILSLTKHGVINVHASLLPKYRGSSPIQWAVINGDKKTGVTIMQTEYEVDSGDIILSESILISDDDTAGILFEKLSVLGAQLVVKALDDIEDGRAIYTAQNHADATHCNILTKQDGRINFDNTPRMIDCFVRGMVPWPTAFFTIGENTFKVFKIEMIVGENHSETGTILASTDDKDSLIISCRDGAVKIIEMQCTGGKRMNVADYLRGHKISVGVRVNE